MDRCFNPLLCNDEEGHRRMWPLMKYLREARAGVRGGWFPDAFKILDDAFGADEWQLERRGEAGHAV